MHSISSMGSFINRTTGSHKNTDISRGIQKNKQPLSSKNCLSKLPHLFITLAVLAILGRYFGGDSVTYINNRLDPENLDPQRFDPAKLDLTQCNANRTSMRPVGDCVSMDCGNYETLYCGKGATYDPAKNGWKKTNRYGLHSFLESVLRNSNLSFVVDQLWYGDHQNKILDQVNEESPITTLNINIFRGMGYRFGDFDEFKSLYEGMHSGYVEGTTTVGGLDQYSATVALQKELNIPIGAYFNLDPNTNKKDHCEIYSKKYANFWNSTNGFIGTEGGRETLVEFFEELRDQSKPSSGKSKLFIFIDGVKGQLQEQIENVKSFFELLIRKNIPLMVVTSDFDSCSAFQKEVQSSFPCFMEHGDVSQAFIQKNQTLEERIENIFSAIDQGEPHVYVYWPITYANRMVGGYPFDSKFYDKSKSPDANIRNAIIGTREDEVVYYKSEENQEMDQEKGKQLQNLIRYRHNLNEGKPPQRKGKNPDKKGLRGGREH